MSTKYTEGHERGELETVHGTHARLILKMAMKSPRNTRKNTEKGGSEWLTQRVRPPSCSTLFLSVTSVYSVDLQSRF